LQALLFSIPRFYSSQGRFLCATLADMSDSFVSRRQFLQTTAALTAAATAAPALSATAPKSSQDETFAWPENGTLIPDEDWRLWLDTEASWKKDDIFLPEDIAWVDGALCAKGKPLAVNAPTGGWAALAADAGKKVVLPTSVEQHFWGQHGAGTDGKPRPYTPEEYRYAADTKGGTITPQAPADDDVPQNGAYYGVSWWHRTIDIPAAMRGKRIFLHVRGAHLRAEVYLNGKLCGYSIMEELPFEADLTAAANPGGENHLAIRITNPFGRFDWVDGLNAKWGKVSLYRSHGFGALDRGMTISSAPAGYRVLDTWALNTPDVWAIEAYATVELPAGKTLTDAPVNFDMLEPRTGKLLGSAMGEEVSRAGGRITVRGRLSNPATKAWELNAGSLYWLRARVIPKQGDTHERTVAFGFRSFTVEGVGAIGTGSNALFRLNGKRKKIYTSISWGFWGLNGMFPVPELAEKEVRAAQALGLNCLNFHRNLAKEDVLRWHDQLGVLRYMEPGAGKFAIGRLPAGASPHAATVVMEDSRTEADKFAQRYMFVKCVEMVKAHRSHPSIIEYCLQNEIGADLKNPATLAVLKAMHAEDPSRCVVLNDGFVALPRKAAQAWYAPWTLDAAGKLTEGILHRSDEHAWGDWWVQHQGAGDQWYDEFYKSPTQFTYRAAFREVITEEGEMEGCARPDVHGLNVDQIQKTYARYGGTSYDLRDHEEIIAGYDAFLDKWGFRKAFPTPDHVFRVVGRTCYESWMNYMENARISDELDFAAISGWESTAVENHSGIVDNLRNFKSDPKLIGDTLMPVRPCAKQRSLAVELGKPATFDLFLLNDTAASVTGTLTFTMLSPRGERTQLLTLPVPTQTPDQFSYLLREAFVTPPLTQEGLYRFKFSLSSAPSATQTKELWVTMNGAPQIVDGRPHIIGVSGIQSALRKQIAKAGFVEVRDFKPGEKYDLIISSGLTSRSTAEQSAGETTGESNPINAVQTTTQQGHLQRGIVEAVQAGTPLLAIPQADSLSEGVAQQLASAGAFQYKGAVGDFRAPWMGNWYFVREHALFSGLPQNCALGGFYQVKGRQSNGVLVEGKDVEVVIGYSRDHDRKVGAGTFTTKLGAGKVLFHRVPDFHPVLQQRFLANAIRWLTSQ
jgi:hypothetical protein